MATEKIIIRGDTGSWIMQVWISFLAAIFLGVIGIFGLPTENHERLIMAIGMLFVLSTSFTLAKTIRDNREERVDTQQWIIQVWISFGIALSLTCWAFYRINVNEWHKLFLACDFLFVIMSTFTLSKTIRDNFEAQMSKNFVS